MDQQNQLYFTIWYGVFNKANRTLRYGGGGHPPAILLTGPTESDAQLQLLEALGPMVGAIPDLEYQDAVCSLGPYSKLFLFSDGAYEVECADKSMWPFHDFIKYMETVDRKGTAGMDALMGHVRALSGQEEFADDFSIVDFQFE